MQPTKTSPALNTVSNHLPSISSIHYHSPHFKDDSSSPNFIKEIVGCTNPPDSPPSKIIFKKALGLYGTCSSFCFGASSCRKSKVKSLKHLKSFFKTRPKSSGSAYSSSSTSSRNVSLISNTLGNREQFLIFSNPVFQKLNKTTLHRLVLIFYLTLENVIILM